MRNLEKYDDVTTPELMGVATRLVSAAVSLLPGRLTRSAAKESLKELVGVAKTKRGRCASLKRLHELLPLKRRMRERSDAGWREPETRAVSASARGELP